jgi:DNA-binding HxlR family transcriptional regulator
VPVGKVTLGVDSARPTSHPLDSLDAGLSILTDAWSFMVVREAFFGIRRFESFRDALAIPRATLSARLKALTAVGILRRAESPGQTSRQDYRLADVGFDLYPVVVAFKEFGDKWLAGRKAPPMELFHTDCGCWSNPAVVCQACGEVPRFDTVSFNGLGEARKALSSPGKRSPRASNPSQYLRVRPCSIARTLHIVGDRWSFLLLLSSFLGARRFDDFQNMLGIGPSILTDRLTRLTGAKLLTRDKYLDAPERFNYLLTPKGQELFAPLIMLLNWAECHLGTQSELMFHTTCRSPLRPAVICNHCRNAIDARHMRYRLHYDPLHYWSKKRDDQDDPGRL